MARVSQDDSGQDHEASLTYVVGRVNQGIRREMRARLAQWKLSVQEFTTLSVLSTRPGLSNAQLARRALVTPQSMIEILSKLERRGLVRREVDPDHARILRSDSPHPREENSSEPQIQSFTRFKKRCWRPCRSASGR